MDTSDGIEHPPSRASAALAAYRDKASAPPAPPADVTTILEHAQKHYKTGSYDEALDAFVHAYAELEAQQKPPTDETVAAVVSNIGCCLHQLDELDAAQVYYEAAMKMFEAMPLSTLDWLLYGNVNERRVEYIKGRLVELGASRKPDASSYLDGMGRKQQWTAADRAGREQSVWSWISPMSWYQYLLYSEARKQGDEQTVQLTSAQPTPHGLSAA